MKLMRRGAPALLGVFVTWLPSTAWALDTEVSADTAAQLYQLRSPTGETLVSRRRLTTTIGVAGYNLIDKPADGGQGPELLFRARARYDADYGLTRAQTDPAQPNSLVPGAGQPPVDIMYAYVEGRRFFHGIIGFKLGRQYVTDHLGWWAFDGATVRATAPFHVAVEALGGIENRGGLPLTTGRWERDGVFRGARGEYDPSLYPSFQPASVAPAMGFAVETEGLTWIHARASYRRVLNTGGVGLTQLPSGLNAPLTYNGTRLSQERVGASVDITPPPRFPQIGGLKAGIAHDLLVSKVSTIFASVDGYVTPKLTASVDYDYYRPTFDGDSIFNFFAAEPSNDFGGRLTYEVTDRLSVAGGGHARLFQVDTTPAPTTSSPNLSDTNNPNLYPSNGKSFVSGGSLSGRYRTPTMVVGLRSSGNYGTSGERVGGDVYGEKLFANRYIVEGRTSLFHWDDKLRQGRDATGFSYVGGVGYRFADRSRALIEGEHNLNRIVGSNVRVMLWVSLAVTP